MYKLILSILFFNLVLYSQNIESKNNKDNEIHHISIINPKNEKSDALILSLKSGYHFDMQDNDYGSKGSWLINAVIGVVMNKHFIMEADIDYWEKTSDNYSLNSENTVYYRNLKGFGAALIFKYKLLLPAGINVSFGAGTGFYRISYSNDNEYYTDNGYLNLCANLGFGVKVLDFQISSKKLALKIDSEMSYYSLVTLTKQKTLYRMINFKIGPSIYLYY